MIALFFEVLPKPTQAATYFTMAAALKPALEASGGLTFLDRSRSLTRPGWFLSHQFWEDEAAMVRWRVNATHHRAQACGRTDVFDDYRLRVAQVIALACSPEQQARSAEFSPSQDHATRVMNPIPAHAASIHPAITAERPILSLLSSGPLPGISGEAFTSVYDPTLTVTIAALTSVADGHAMLAAIANAPNLRTARLCLISRDYGMFDRIEAPQFFEPVTLA